MVSLVILLFLSCAPLVPAQVPSPAPAVFTPVAPPPAKVTPPIVCTLPNTTMISPNYCNAHDEQSMENQTAVCDGFLTMSVDIPSAECCTGLNNVAYNRTACICKKAFYPPTNHNASRQLGLPRLCGVRTDLCGQCPMFTVPSGSGDSSNLTRKYQWRKYFTLSVTVLIVLYCCYLELHCIQQRILVFSFVGIRHAYSCKGLNNLQHSCMAMS